MKTIKIGKSRDNDCILSADDVSRSHAVLLLSDPQHGTLRDLSSKNGTFVNNKRITECQVIASDSIRFASETMTIASILAKTNETVVRQKDDTPAGAVCRTIGRATNCDIPMGYDDVSHRHAVLYQTLDGNVYIEDCNSRNGTYVNGIKISCQKLNTGDQVTITRNHSLNWESYFQPTKKSRKPTAALKTLAAAAIAALVFIGGYFLWGHFSTWDKERIYEEYNSAVCWIYVEYGYKVYVNNQDLTPVLCQISGIESRGLIHFNEDGTLAAGPGASEGTGFFIREDGVIATNLHVAKPWLFTGHMEKLNNEANKIVALLATQDPLQWAGSQVKVENVIAMYIVPNGLPISSGNTIKCTELNSYDDTNKDVALIQTESRSLPQSVKHIIDIKTADLSEEALKEGKAVFTIGFPYGNLLAQNSNQELKNQVHGGSITQNRGSYEFGHDAATAGGASGSPILNDKGKLIGIHHAGLTGVTGAQGFNMGIKAKYIVELLNK